MAAGLFSSMHTERLMVVIQETKERLSLTQTQDTTLIKMIEVQRTLGSPIAREPKLQSALNKIHELYLNTLNHLQAILFRQCVCVNFTITEFNAIQAEYTLKMLTISQAAVRILSRIKTHDKTMEPLLEKRKEFQEKAAKWERDALVLLPPNTRFGIGLSI